METPTSDTCRHQLPFQAGTRPGYRPIPGRLGAMVHAGCRTFSMRQPGHQWASLCGVRRLAPLNRLDTLRVADAQRVTSVRPLSRLFVLLPPAEATGEETARPSSPRDGNPGEYSQSSGETTVSESSVSFHAHHTAQQANPSSRLRLFGPASSQSQVLSGHKRQSNRRIPNARLLARPGQAVDGWTWPSACETTDTPHAVEI